MFHFLAVRRGEEGGEEEERDTHVDEYLMFLIILHSIILYLTNWSSVVLTPRFISSISQA